jgi:C4-dicarboxylate transporter
MAENGILNNVGVSKRSATGITAMVMLMKLSTSDGKYALPAMIGITILAVTYMIANEIKDRRNGKEL